MLRLVDVSVAFGGITAVDGVTLDVEAGTLTGLIGPNGAGKTTLFDVVNGLRRPTHGEVFVDGVDVTRARPHKLARLGIARTFQRLELWGQLTVEESIAVAADIRHSWSGDDALAPGPILERVGLGSVADERTDSLPTGQARLAEIARALATRPRLLLLDEPASGLSERETEALADLLRALRDDGLTILLVEHDMSLVMAVSDVVHVLDVGRLIASGSPAEVQRDDTVLAAYLGTTTRG